MNYHQIELSKKQKEELVPFVIRVNKKVNPICLICFAASSKSVVAQGPLPFPANEQSNTYGVLVITAKKVNRQYLQKLAKATAGYCRIVVITHNWDYLVARLREKNKFFESAVHGGLLLSGDQIRPTLSGSSQNELYPWAQLNFDYYIEYALKFSEAASLCKSQDHEGSSLYLLYQTVLQSCFTLIWVYSFYEPDFDDLDVLLNLCYCLEPRLEKYFQREKSVNSFHFDALAGIHRHVHFNNDFEVIDRDAEIISAFADHFCEMVITFCHERIDAYKELVTL